MYNRAGGQILSIIPIESPPAIYSMFPAYGHLHRLGRKPSLPPVALWKLPPEDVGDDGARVCTDSFNFIPAIIDHEE